MDFTKFQQQLDQLQALWAQAQSNAQNNELSPLDSDVLKDSIRGLYKLFFEINATQPIQNQEVIKEQTPKREVEFVINEPIAEAQVEPEKVEEQPIKKAKFIYTNSHTDTTKTEESPITNNTAIRLTEPNEIEQPIVLETKIETPIALPEIKIETPIIEIAKPQLPVIEEVKPVVETKIETPIIEIAKPQLPIIEDIKPIIETHQPTTLVVDTEETQPTQVQIIQDTLVPTEKKQVEPTVEMPIIPIIQVPVIEEVKPVIEKNITDVVVTQEPPVIETQPVVVGQKIENSLDIVVPKETSPTPKLAGFNPDYDELFSFQSATELSQKLSDAPIEDLNKALGLNEKYLYINELFAGKAAQFKISIDFFNTAKSLDEAREYMERDLIEKQQWLQNKDKKILAKNFIKLIRRRYLAK